MIFDTAIFRNVEVPSDVFLLVSMEIGWNQFADARITAERVAKEKYRQTHNSGEVPLKEIYNVLSERYDLNPALIEKEIEFEKYLSVSNLYFKRLFDRLIAEEKTIVFTTDSYLPREVIEHILAKNKFVGYKALYVSNELDLSKTEGTLQGHLRQIYGADKKIFHIGDNYRSDIKNSKIWGIDTTYYHSVRDVSKPFREPKINDLSQSFYRGIINNALHNGTWKETLHYEHGFKVGGILCAGYCEYINRVIDDKEIDLVLFCSRDCEIIHKIYNSFYKKVDNQYIFVSRFALMNIAPERFIFDLVDRSLKNSSTENKSIKSLLSDLSLSILESKLESYGFQAYEKIQNDNISKLKKMISENMDLILEDKKSQILAAKKYFEKVIGKHKRILVVDVGWSGSSFSILKYFLEKNLRKKFEVFGLLMFASDNKQTASQISSGNLDSYITSLRKIGICLQSISQMTQLFLMNTTR